MELEGPQLPWGRLRRLLGQLPVDAAFHRSRADGPVWSIDTHLLANIADSVAAANWQRSKDGDKQSKAPKPFPRPGAVDPSKKTHGDTSMLTPAATRALLDRLKPKS